RQRARHLGRGLPHLARLVPEPRDRPLEAADDLRGPALDHAARLLEPLRADARIDRSLAAGAIAGRFVAGHELTFDMDHLTRAPWATQRTTSARSSSVMLVRLANGMVSASTRTLMRRAAAWIWAGVSSTTPFGASGNSSSDGVVLWQATQRSEMIACTFSNGTGGPAASSWSDGPERAGCEVRYQAPPTAASAHAASTGRHGRKWKRMFMRWRTSAPPIISTAR